MVNHKKNTQKSQLTGSTCFKNLKWLLKTKNGLVKP
jgi:hypothetical protein